MSIPLTDYLKKELISTLIQSFSSSAIVRMIVQIRRNVLVDSSPSNLSNVKRIMWPKMMQDMNTEDYRFVNLSNDQ